MQQKTVQILSGALFLGLLVWGTYALIAYLGVPVHGLVLLSGEGQEAVKQACTHGSLFCRGAVRFFHFLGFTFTRAQPFLPYASVSLLAYVVFVLWPLVRLGRLQSALTMKPWHLLLLFFGSLWLMFTVLSYGKIGDIPLRRIFEPTTQVYQQVGEEGMQELKSNFASLEKAGCLSYVARTVSGASVYDLKTSCMQVSFLNRVMSQALFILILLFELLVAGRFVLSLFRIRVLGKPQEALFSAITGACGFIVLLWLYAVFGMFFGWVGWATIVLVPLLLYRHSIYWVKTCFLHRFEVSFRWRDLRILVLWLLVSYLALNFINVVRPFPIGWDDLGSYLNRPRLLVSYGHFVFSMSPFQWEYLTSLGFLLFGYESFFGATASMMVNWMAGLLAVATVFVFVQTFLGRGYGALSALLLYSLPLVGHFSYADMKIDNAVFTMGAACLFAVFLALFPSADEDVESADVSLRRRWLPLAGALGGFALAIKPTSLMTIAAAGTVLFGASLHWVAFIGSVFLALFVFTAKGAFSIPNITSRLFGEAIGRTGFVSLFLMLGLAGTVFALLKDRRVFRTFAVNLGMFASAFALSIAPWVIHNNILLGNVVPRFEMGAPNTLSPTMVLFGGKENAADFGQDIRTLPPELALDINHPTCSPTGTVEELDRYWGYGKGWRHYATLPWRTVLNLDSTGYYVTTMPALLLVPLVLLLPYFWSRRGRWLRWLFVGTFFMLLQWMFMANGIPWYGVGMFLGLCIVLEVLVARAPDLPNKVLAGLLVTLSLFISFSNRFWQFDQQRNIFEYAIGKITATALRERTIPHYDDVSAVVVDRHVSVPNRPYLFRVGTFIPYFIPRNLEIVGLADHQLDTFNCLFQERNPSLTLQRLKALGFNSIIFDTNTATIESNQNGTLHTKVEAFVGFLNTTSLGLQVMVNDLDAGVVFLLIP